MPPVSFKHRCMWPPRLTIVHPVMPLWSSHLVGDHRLYFGRTATNSMCAVSAMITCSPHARPRSCSWGPSDQGTHWRNIEHLQFECPGVPVLGRSWRWLISGMTPSGHVLDPIMPRRCCWQRFPPIVSPSWLPRRMYANVLSLSSSALLRPRAVIRLGA